jgi:3-dehydroquinate dehydratase-2
MKIQIINGPNLNLLGIRETGIYGEINFESFLDLLNNEFPDVEINFFQSNIEGEIIDKLHQTGFSADGIILNAAAYTHTSVAIGDAIKAIKTPVVEVHISNIFSREDFRHVSFIAPHCRGTITGFGLQSYRLALLSFLEI